MYTSGVIPSPCRVLIKVVQVDGGCSSHGMPSQPEPVPSAAHMSRIAALTVGVPDSTWLQLGSVGLVYSVVMMCSDDVGTAATASAAGSSKGLTATRAARTRLRVRISPLRSTRPTENQAA